MLREKLKRTEIGAKRQLVEKNECMVYVPILESLEALLNNDVIRGEVIINCNMYTVHYAYIEVY